MSALEPDDDTPEEPDGVAEPEREGPEALPDGVSETGEMDGKGYLYYGPKRRTDGEPDEVLLRDEDAATDEPERGRRDEAERRLGDMGFREQESPVRGVRVFRRDERGEDARPVHEIIPGLRDGGRPIVYPHHALFSAPHRTFGPARRAVNAAPRRLRWRENRPTGVGAGVKVAVIDTGISKHAWFGGKFNSAANEDLEPPAGRPQLDDFDGHGTFITGVILRYAPDAEVRAKRVGMSGCISDLDLAVLITKVGEWADIVNLSLGGYTADDKGLLAVPIAMEQVAKEKPDLVFVAAAGNANVHRPYFPAASRSVPGSTELQVVAVAAANADGSKADFSNYGDWVMLNAPGVDVLGPYVHLPAQSPGEHGPWVFWSGTSFAAPYVTGALAARWQRGAGWRAVTAVSGGPPSRQGLAIGTAVYTRSYAREVDGNNP
jgi:hypothetical protein